MDLDGITLPDTLLWENEHTWNQIGQTHDRSVTGAIVLQEQRKSYGREIDLVGTDDSEWATKALIDSLYAKEYELNKKMVLTLPDARTFTVRFNRAGGAAIQAPRFWRWGGHDNPDPVYYLARIRLITVEP